MRERTPMFGVGIAIVCGGLGRIWACCWGGRSDVGHEAVKAGTAIVVVMVLMWSAITGAAEVVMLFKLIRPYVAGSYPTVPGTVRESRVKEESDGEGSSYRAIVR